MAGLVGSTIIKKGCYSNHGEAYNEVVMRDRGCDTPVEIMESVFRAYVNFVGVYSLNVSEEAMNTINEINLIDDPPYAIILYTLMVDMGHGDAVARALRYYNTKAKNVGDVLELYVI